MHGYALDRVYSFFVSVSVALPNHQNETVPIRPKCLCFYSGIFMVSTARPIFGDMVRKFSV